MRLIDAEELIKKIQTETTMPGWCKALVYAVIYDVNVAEVAHGQWEKSEDDYYGLNIIKCSLCQEEWCFEVADDVKELNYNYCPNCGAKMDGGKND